ncbi:MAG: hypothetical protein ACI4DY_01230 [Monoglobaceae bacterium]
MLNEIAEFEAYTKKPEYKRDGKNDNSFLGRFTCEGIQGFEGFTRVLTIIARGYMFKNGNADIEYAGRAISAWCSIPDKTNSEKEDWHFKTDFRQYHHEFPELVSENGEGWFYRHFHNAMNFAISNPDKFTAKEIEKYALMDKNFDNAWRKKVTQIQYGTYDLNTKGAWILRFDDILSSALELGELKNKDFELLEEAKAKIADFTKTPSTAFALETLVKYYYANRQDDTDWVVLPVANFDAYFGSTSFSKKCLTELVKSGAIERENSYNVSRYRVNEGFETKNIV